MYNPKVQEHGGNDSPLLAVHCKWIKISSGSEVWPTHQMLRVIIRLSCFIAIMANTMMLMPMRTNVEIYLLIVSRSVPALPDASIVADGNNEKIHKEDGDTGH